MDIKEKLIALIKQAFKFGIVGVVSTVIDMGLYYVFYSFCGIYYVTAATLSFLISLVFNYVCSMKYVFVGKKDANKVREFLIFFILSAIGLGMNDFLIWLLHGKYHLGKMIAKIFATAVVMVWNFVSRKIFIEEKNPEIQETGEQ
ncbi:MAG: GtrA family protein [Lachnospiraceae bacterium]